MEEAEEAEEAGEVEAEEDWGRDSLVVDGHTFDLRQPSRRSSLSTLDLEDFRANSGPSTPSTALTKQRRRSLSDMSAAL